MTRQKPESIARFLHELRHHLSGWKAKAQRDFSRESFQNELKSLANDPVYSRFHLAHPDYVFIRLMGRMSVSIGRRLGEIYDKIPRMAAQARYGLSHDKVAVRFQTLELDLCIRLQDLGSDDCPHLSRVVRKHFNVDLAHFTGVGAEIRYNFNPNDSARLRKDKAMAGYLRTAGLYPVYLVFAENSPRLRDAIASLKRAGWHFLIGRAALAFMTDLVGFDISNVLDRPEISNEVKEQIGRLLLSIRDSYAANRFLSKK